MDRRSLMIAAAGLPLGLCLNSQLANGTLAQADESLSSAQLRVIGVLTAATTQDVFLLLDLAAASLAKEGLSADRVRTLSKAMVRQLDGVIGQLRKMEDINLAKDDAAFVDSAMQVCRSLQDDARALGRYADKQTSADQKTFERTHQKAEQSLRELLEEKSVLSEGE